jgi:hypothetical protein
MSETSAPAPEAAQALWDAEDVADLARSIVEAETRKEAAQAAAALSLEAAHKARDLVKAQRAVLEQLLGEFARALPAPAEAAALLGDLRAARIEELRLRDCETEARLAHLEQARALMKAESRALALVDALGNEPLIDLMIQNARTQQAAEEAQATRRTKKGGAA